MNPTAETESLVVVVLRRKDRQQEQRARAHIALQNATSTQAAREQHDDHRGGRADDNGVGEKEFFRVIYQQDALCDTLTF